MMEVGNYSKEAKNIKMAEALCSDIIYAHNFHSITVASTTDKNRVEIFCMQIVLRSHRPM